jgi:hypothetical protein
MPEGNDQQRETEKDSPVRRWREASAAFFVTGIVIVVAFMVLIFVLAYG